MRKRGEVEKGRKKNWAWGAETQRGREAVGETTEGPGREEGTETKRNGRLSLLPN